MTQPMEDDVVEPRGPNTYEKTMIRRLKEHETGERPVQPGQGLHPGQHAGPPNHDMVGYDVYMAGRPDAGAAWYQKVFDDLENFGWQFFHKDDEAVSCSHDHVWLTAMLFCWLLAWRAGNAALQKRVVRWLRGYLWLVTLCRRKKAPATFVSALQDFFLQLWDDVLGLFGLRASSLPRNVHFDIGGARSSVPDENGNVVGVDQRAVRAEIVATLTGELRKPTRNLEGIDRASLWVLARPARLDQPQGKAVYDVLVPQLKNLTADDAPALRHPARLWRWSTGHLFEWLDGLSDQYRPDFWTDSDATIRGALPWSRYGCNPTWTKLDKGHQNPPIPAPRPPADAMAIRFKVAPGSARDAAGV